MSIDSVGADTEVTSDYESLKVCTKCNEEKTFVEFYKNKDAADGRHSRCKKCMIAAQNGRHVGRRQLEAERVNKLPRIQKFIHGHLPLSDLSKEEIDGRFLYDDQGRPVALENIPDSTEKFVAKFNRELVKRITRYIQTKSLRAVEVVFEIADSDANEAADRFKAATWLAERVIGKTPDVILTADVGKTYEGIFDTTVESGSREDYRRRVESVREETHKELEQPDSRNGVHSDSGRNSVLDVEEVEDENEERAEFRIPQDNLDGETKVVGYDEKVLSGQQNGSESLGSSGNHDGQNGIHDGRRSNNGGNSESNQDTGITVIGEKRSEFREEKERLRKARQKAKQRRFAARAVGATSLDRLPYLLEFQLIKTGALAGKLMCRLVCPDALTEARLGKLVEVNALTDDALKILYPWLGTDRDQEEIVIEEIYEDVEIEEK